MKYIALIRAVTPMGKNKVPMAQLRELLGQSGEFSNVQTYIQSGNVLLETVKSAKYVADEIHTIIKNNFGGELLIVVKTPKQLQSDFQGYPFADVPTEKQYYTFLSAIPTSEGLEKLAQRDFGADKYKIVGDVLYIALQTSASTSRLTNNAIEQKLGLPATTRNYNTTKKMLELSKND